VPLCGAVQYCVRCESGATTLILLRRSIRLTASSDLKEPLHQLHSMPEIADPVVYSS